MPLEIGLRLAGMSSVPRNKVGTDSRAIITNPMATDALWVSNRLAAAEAAFATIPAAGPLAGAHTAVRHAHYLRIVLLGEAVEMAEVRVAKARSFVADAPGRGCMRHPLSARSINSALAPRPMQKQKKPFPERWTKMRLDVTTLPIGVDYDPASRWIAQGAGSAMAPGGKVSLDQNKRRTQPSENYAPTCRCG